MKKGSEVICGDNGIEINVEYEYEVSESQLEYGHGQYDVGGLVDTDATVLKVIELIIAGKGLDITNQLTKKQKEAIKSLLTYQ